MGILASSRLFFTVIFMFFASSQLSSATISEELYSVEFEIKLGETIVGRPQAIVAAGEAASIQTLKGRGYLLSMVVDEIENPEVDTRVRRLTVSSKLFFLDRAGRNWVPVASPVIDVSEGSRASMSVISRIDDESARLSVAVTVKRASAAELGATRENPTGECAEARRILTGDYPPKVSANVTALAAIKSW